MYVHQKVKVKLAPYPFQKYGMLDGEVTHIQADSDSDARAQDDESAGDKPQAPSAYKAIVALDSQFLEAEDRKFKLVPGMQVVAEINQGDRTVLKYLLDPVSKTLGESGRER